MRSFAVLVLAIGCGAAQDPASTGDAPVPASPVVRDVEAPPRASVAATAPVAVAAARVEPEPEPEPPKLADPKLGSENVTVVARIVGLPKRMPPACGGGYFSIFIEYEVVEVDAGTIAGTRFFAVHGCPEMLRTRLKSLKVGDVHRLELSTNAKYRRGMLPPKPRPPFYFTKRVDKA